MNTPPDDGLIRVDEHAFKAWKGDKPLRLPLKVFRLLAVLAAHAGAVVTREELMREVWETTWLGSSKTIDMHVSTLRRLIGDDPAEPRYLATVRGVGFRLEEDVVAHPEAEGEVIGLSVDYRLPLRVANRQMIHDADGVLVAVAMSPQGARWIVERANENYVVEAQILEAVGHG